MALIIKIGQVYVQIRVIFMIVAMIQWNDYEGVINKFEEVVGIHYLKVIHINDSKNARGSHKDRHENIGFGYLGFDTINKICNDHRFEKIPKILETPYVEVNKNLSYPPYKYEIEMFKMVNLIVIN